MLYIRSLELIHFITGICTLWSITPYCPNWYFFAPAVFWNFLSWTWTSPKALSSVGDYLRKRFPGAPRLWLRGAGVSSWTTVGPTVRTKYCLPIYLMHGWVRPPSRAFGIQCWIPQLSEGTFVRDGWWIFVVGGGQTWRMSSAIMMLVFPSRT